MSILLVAAAKLNLTIAISSLLSTLTTPIQTPLTYTRQQKDQFASFIFRSPHLLSENVKLKNEVGALKILLEDYEEELGDSLLREKLAKNHWQIQPVRLVSLDNSVTFTSRSFESLRPGQPVVSGNTLIGLVKSVSPPVIKVIPMRHTDLKIPVQLETGAKGEYSYRANEPTISNLDSSTIFNPQTLVFTLPGEQVPPRLILGQIDKITSSPANPTQEAILKLDQEINTGHDFFIITKP